MSAHLYGPASRRAFLKRSAYLSALAGTPFAASLATLGAHAQSTGDYKALVCVFLFGGNDHANTIVPITGTDYARYATARNQCALPAASLLPISPANYNGTPLGLHPSLRRMKALFDGGKCAVMANVGPLVVPITKAQWNNGSPTVPVPYQLTSHSNQQSAWQTGIPDASSETGWFGRMGDVLSSGQAGSGVPICISTAGDNTMQIGASASPYQITSNGAIRINGLDGLYDTSIGSALHDVMTQDTGAHLMETHYAGIAKRAIDTETLVTNGLNTAGMTTTIFASDRLSQQLMMVARLIKARTAYGHRRQIFFVGLGGFDFHDDLLAGQASRLTEVDNALASFYEATVEMGVENQVTAFTASDFGRALRANGDGSDHGWGGHHFVVGGAVRGRRIAGQFPEVALNTANDAGNGILIPTTSVDQYAAALATWFGVPVADLPRIMPNVARFPSGADLGLFI